MSVIPSDQITHKGLDKFFTILNANLTDPRTQKEKDREPRDSETDMVRFGSYPETSFVYPHVVALFVGGSGVRMGGHGNFFEFLMRFGADVIAKKTKHVDNLIDQILNVLRTNRQDFSDYRMHNLTFANLRPSPYVAGRGELHGTLIEVEFAIDLI